ncbi:MAG: GntR family transcriptional regulator [Burkholderiaceae bacterium]|nr:GntR family transcriptional regulator [Burkholderiaceae bacterium]
MPNASLRQKTAEPEARRAAVFTPLYKQIKQMLVQDLDRGAWKPGELIPSELELAARFQVSQGTVRKAIDELAAENLLVRRQGKGTFVATHQEPRAQFRFLRIVPDEGEPRPATSRFLECRRLRAPAEVARQLELKTGDAVVYIRRLLLFEHKPLIVDDIWLPGGTFRGLTAERLADYHGPLYGLFESEFGTRMIRAAERLRARGAEPDIAALLGVAPGTPLLLVDRVSFTYGDRPVEVRRGHCLTERHHYRNTLT